MFPLPFFEELKARNCHPEECEDLTTALLIEYTFMTAPFHAMLIDAKDVPSARSSARVRIPPENCPHLHRVKDGFRTIHGERVQKYRCKDCRRRVPRPGCNSGMHIKREIIEFAKKLSADPTLSVRTIATRIQEVYHVRVSYVSVSKWNKSGKISEPIEADNTH